MRIHKCKGNERNSLISYARLIYVRVLWFIISMVTWPSFRRLSGESLTSLRIPFNRKETKQILDNPLWSCYSLMLCRCSARADAGLLIFIWSALASMCHGRWRGAQVLNNIKALGCFFSLWFLVWIRCEDHPSALTMYAEVCRVSLMLWGPGGHVVGKQLGQTRDH